jgi:hypothetical protein
MQIDVIMFIHGLSQEAIRNREALLKSYASKAPPVYWREQNVARKKERML